MNIIRLFFIAISFFFLFLAGSASANSPIPYTVSPIVDDFPVAGSGLTVNNNFKVDDFDVDSTGMFWGVDKNRNKIYKFDKNKIVGAYGASSGYFADGSLNSLFFNAPSLIKAKNSSVYFYEYRRLRKIDLNNNTVTTIMGNGTSGLPAMGSVVSASTPLLDGITSLAVDDNENIYFSVNYNIYRVDASTKVISLVGGTSSFGYSGEGGPAINAKFGNISSMALKGSDLFVADANRVRKISGGITTTVVNLAGTAGAAGDGGSGSAAQANTVSSLVVNGDILYFSDKGNSRIRKLDLVSNNVSLVSGFDSGDVNSSLSASRYNQLGTIIFSDNVLYVVDENSSSVASEASKIKWNIKKVDLNKNKVSVLAGKNLYNVSQTPAKNFSFYNTGGTLYNHAIDSQGNIYVAKKMSTFDNNIKLSSQILKISADGMITAIAGNTSSLASEKNNGSSLTTLIDQPSFVTVDNNGLVYYVDKRDLYNSRIRKIENGVTSTVLTTDGNLNSDNIKSISFDSNNNMFIGTQFTLYKRTPTGTITVMNPNGGGTGADGEPLASASMCLEDIDIDKATDDIYYFDGCDKKIRVIRKSNSLIYNLAGGGTSLNDPVAANNANIQYTRQVKYLNGSVFFVDSGSIKRLTAGQISTITNSSSPYSPNNYKGMNIEFYKYLGNLSVNPLTNSLTVESDGGSALYNIDSDNNFTTTDPLIQGNYKEGQTLTVNNGTWPNETTHTYKWFRCDQEGNNCNQIISATSPTYTLTAADAEKTVVASVTNGSAKALSQTTGIIEQLPPTVTLTGPSGNTNNKNPSWIFQTDKGTLECKLDTDNWAACASPKTYSNLQDGSHTFSVRATGTDGQISAVENKTINLDTVVPQEPTVPADVPSGTITTNSPTWTFRTSESNTTFECRIDGTAWTACTSPKTYSNLSEGSHTFELRTVDQAGNVSQNTITKTVSIDSQGPTTTITAPTTPTNNKTIVWSFTANETATFECQIDGGAWTTCSSPFTLNNAADGNHVLKVRGTDQLNNIGNTASSTVTVDTALPVIIITGPEGKTKNTSPSWSFTSKNGSTFQCSLDNAAFTACTSPYTTNNLTEGEHVFKVRATDTVGNESTIYSKTITFETTKPVATITKKPAAVTKAADFKFEFTADETSTFECKLDAGSWLACSSPKTYYPLTEGSHTFNVRATDTAGNISDVLTETAVVDNTKPTVSLTGTTGLINTNNASWTWTTDDPAATNECKLDTAEWTACPSQTINMTNLTEGDHTFSMRSTDTAGNISSVVSKTITVDTTPAKFTVYGPEGTTKNNNPTWTFTAQETQTTFQCRLDEKTWETCTSPKTYTNLAEGTHKLEIKNTDKAGNTTEVQTKEINVDTIKPTIELAGTEGTILTNTGTWTFTTSEPSTTECRLDNKPWTKCTSPTTITSILKGKHTFEVRATDNADNTSETKTKTFTVDTTNTTITPEEINKIVTAENIKITTDSTGGINFKAPDMPAGTKLMCKNPAINQGQWTECSTINMNELPAGNNTLEIQAFDTQNNPISTPITKNITINPVCFKINQITTAKGTTLYIYQQAANTLIKIISKPKTTSTQITLNGKQYKTQNNTAIIPTEEINKAIRGKTTLTLSLQTLSQTQKIVVANMNCTLKPATIKKKIKGQKKSLIIDFNKNKITLNNKAVTGKINKTTINKGKITAEAIKTLQLNPRSQLTIKGQKTPVIITIK